MIGSRSTTWPLWEGSRIFAGTPAADFAIAEPCLPWSPTSTRYGGWWTVLCFTSQRAFHALGELELGGWASSMGAGLRVWVPGGLVFEQLVARSEEELRLLVNFKTIF